MNDNQKSVMAFDGADAPMLLYALSAGANVAMMSGRRDAESALRALALRVASRMPEAAGWFHGIVFSEALMAARGASDISVRIEGMSSLVICIDGEDWRGEFRNDKDKPDASDIAAVREALTPPSTRWTMDLSMGDVALMSLSLCRATVTAAMWGRREAQRRLSVLGDVAEAALPGVAKHFDLLDFGEMAAAVAQARSWHVGIAETRYDWTLRAETGCLQVVADGRFWRSRGFDRFLQAGPEVAALREWLDPLTSMDAVYGLDFSGNPSNSLAQNPF